MPVFSAALVALGIAYAIALARHTSAFRRYASSWKPHLHDRLPTVTVIVAARNEAPQISSCVRSVAANDYPTAQVEIVVVDDASEDETAGIVAALSLEIPRLTLVRAAGAGARGKRHAIEMGIAASTGEIILLTDADCIAPRAWIRSMVACFDAKTRFVAGPVAYSSGKTWLGRILELELLGLVTIGGGAIALRHPNMCNGANIGFRRATFLDVGGYAGTDRLTSGDDELLMHKIARAHPGSVGFCPDPNALVETAAPGSLPELFQQRRRWASKGLSYDDKGITLLALIVYLFNLALLVSLATGLLGATIWTALVVAILLKVGAEGWLFWTACRRFGRLYLLPGLVSGQLFEVPYVVVVGAAGAAGGYRWKGRDIRR